MGQFAYVVMGNCPGAWNGFSWSALHNLGAFARLSIGYAIMMCLEIWYYTFLVLLVGRLKNPGIVVTVVSICNTLNGWEIMVFLGFNVAISVRISNELGAGRPRAAKFSILVVVLSAALLGLIFLSLVLALKDVYALPFTGSVSIGAGWQWLVAFVNVACYYLLGGFFLGSKQNMGVHGIWYGMATGVVMQTLILIGVTLKTDWNKEAKLANSRMKKWGARLSLQRKASTLLSNILDRRFE